MAADRIHPNDSPYSSGELSTKPLGVSSKHSHPSGTYVIELPKDQIYRIPPPENTRKFQEYSDQKRSRRRNYCCCFRCFCWTIGFLALVALLLAVTAIVLYLIFRPESPKYSVDNVAIRGLNLTSSSRISPTFDVTIRAENPNDKIGIYYVKGSAANVYSSGLYLGDGVLPAFYQASNNLTVFHTVLKGPNIVLTSAVKSDLKAKSKNRSVPLRMNVKVPVRIKIGALKTWTITFKVNCDVTVDNLTANSKIISKDCKYRVNLW